MRVPFGIHRGKDVTDVPGQYLAWLATQAWLKDPFASAVREELQARRNRARVPDTDVHEMLGRIVKIGFRTLSKEFHPDTGGSHGDMVALNKAHERLLSLADRL